MKRKAFTFLEILMVLIIISILAALAVVGYSRYKDKAISVEAKVGIGHIRQAEEAYKLSAGTYVGAGSTDEINELLGIKLIPRYYEYKVVNATQDNFLVLAKRIGEDLGLYLGEGIIPSDYTLLAMDKSGIVSNSSLFAPEAGGQSGGGTSTIGGGGWGSVGGGFLSGGGSGGGGGGIGGGGSGGGGGGVVVGGSPGTYTYGGNYEEPVGDIYNAQIAAALNMLADITTNLTYTTVSGTVVGNSPKYYFDLLEARSITPAYGTTTDDALGEYSYQWYNSTGNIVSQNLTVRSNLQTSPGWPTETIAAIILHEAVHVDFLYNSAVWDTRIQTLWPPPAIDPTLLRDPKTNIKIDGTVIHPLYSSITQEYFAFSSEAQFWANYKDDYSGVPGAGIVEEDAIYDYDQQGEAYLRSILRASYNLPEFYPGN